MPLKTYICVMRDTSIRLVGPVDTQDDATEWAVKPGKYGVFGDTPATNNPDDDPRWQCLELETSNHDDSDGFMRDDIGAAPNHYMVPVFAPGDGPMPPSDPFVPEFMPKAIPELTAEDVHLIGHPDYDRLGAWCILGIVVVSLGAFFLGRYVGLG